MQTIVVPAVDSPAGHLALELAKERASGSGAELILVGTANVADQVADNVAAVKDFLARLEADLTAEGVRVRTEWYVGESLGRATVVAAREHGADLVVVGLRRRSAVGKAILGSYEQEILMDAPCPVLSVRPPH